MITREKEPANLEMPFSVLDGFITPNEKFYVRSHFPVPEIDVRTWKLKIGGTVERTLEIGYEELLAMEPQTLTATIECAGNSRVFLVPKVKGVQWELGAVGNAEWTGVPLRRLLERAGLKAEAQEVVLEGADEGTISEAPKPAGRIHYSRGVPVEKAMDDVLLAFRMNGEPLTPSHGHPLRAIVPGWYGMASIKWLKRIVVLDRAFQGYYQTVDYAYWQPGDYGPVLVPLSEMQIKSEIARPGIGEIIPAGCPYRVAGAAWTPSGEITGVEFSSDAGDSWQNAKLLGEAVPNAWRLWEFEWEVPDRAGSYTLLSRATDSNGRVQPESRDANRGGYMVNHCLPIEVEVR